MGLTEIYTVTRYKILQITILSEFFFSFNFYNIKNQYSRWSLTPVHLQVAELKNNQNISSAKTIIMYRLLFHQEQMVEILDLKRA